MHPAVIAAPKVKNLVKSWKKEEEEAEELYLQPLPQQ